MHVQCTNCDWNGDSDDGRQTEFSENEHGVETAEVVCPDCGGELVEA